MKILENKILEKVDFSLIKLHDRPYLSEISINMEDHIFKTKPLKNFKGKEKEDEVKSIEISEV